MNPGTRPRRLAAKPPATGLLATGLMAICLASLAGCGAAAPAGAPQPGSSTAVTVPASYDFSWFKAGHVPAGWHFLELPDRTAALAYPPGASPVQSDPGTVAAGVTAPDGHLLIYLNATPRQGTESLANWRSFRIDHLRGEHAMQATLGASGEGLAFRGGTGSCVLDDYVTRIGAHHYREIACLVSGAAGSSVIVAATLASDWDHYRTTLEQAVESYAVR